MNHLQLDDQFIYGYRRLKIFRGFLLSGYMSCNKIDFKSFQSKNISPYSVYCTFPLYLWLHLEFILHEHDACKMQLWVHLAFTLNCKSILWMHFQIKKKTSTSHSTWTVVMLFRLHSTIHVQRTVHGTHTFLLCTRCISQCIYIAHCTCHFIFT